MLSKLNIGEPNDVTLTGLKNRKTGAYINNATPTIEVRDSGDGITAGNRIGSQATMDYVSSSNGNYVGTLTEATCLQLLPENSTTGDTGLYWIWISVSGYTLRKIPCKAVYRERV